jgi:polysaccharide biosynthesis transport protein
MSEIFDWMKKREMNSAKGAALAGVERITGPLPIPERIFALPPESREPHFLAGVSEFEISAGDPILAEMTGQNSFQSEQYRFLRTKLSLRQREVGLRSVLITSTIPGEGKTITTCSLAAMLAQEPGRRVLLIEADMRRPAAAIALGCENSEKLPGLSQVLQGEITPGDALLKSANIQLFLLPSGGKPANPAELLGSPKLESTLKTMAESFDWVIIDSPPVLGIADALLLAAVADFTLFVIRAGFTPGNLIQEAVQRIGHEKIGGIAMNRIKQSRHHGYYYSNYYSGYNAKSKK